MVVVKNKRKTPCCIISLNFEKKTVDYFFDGTLFPPVACLLAKLEHILYMPVSYPRPCMNLPVT